LRGPTSKGRGEKGKGKEEEEGGCTPPNENPAYATAQNPYRGFAPGPH